MSAETPKETPRQAAFRTFVAGTTTAVVIIPQGMAYALVAGLEPIHGLYASLLPLIVYAFVGRSREMAVGPGALDTLLVGASLSGLAFVNESNYAVYAALLSVEVAVIQLVLGALRAGFLVNFLSRPVISGFTSAAALTIGFSQMRNLLGYPAEKSPYFFDILQRMLVALPESNPATAAVGLISAIALVALKKWNKRFPRALVVVAIATIAVWLLGLESRNVAIIGDIPRGFPGLSVPELDMNIWLELLPTALAISFVGYLTMISIAQTFANRNRYDIDANRELMAAGAANMAAGFTMGFPVSASFSRSAVHAGAGSTSPRTLLIVAGWVALTLLFLTDLLYYLPKATLAAIIITAVFGLIDYKIVPKLWRIKRADAVLLIITFASTLRIGIEAGILIGALASIMLFMYRTTNPHTAVLGRVGNTTDFRNVKNYEDTTTYPGMIIVRIDAQFYFANVNFLKSLLKRLEAESEEELRAVVIEAASLNQLDSSADAALHELYDDYQTRGITLSFASVKMPVLRVMKASGLADKIGQEHFFMNVNDAVECVRAGDELDTSEFPRTPFPS